MARLVLHIGTHHTGSTALQRRFAAHAGLLAQHGLIWPRLEGGPAFGHHGLVAAWNPALKPQEPPEGAAAALQRIVQAYGDSDATVLLSSAEFSRGQQGARVDFRALRAQVAGFRSVEVICVLRDPWQFVQAACLGMAGRAAAQPPGQILEATLRNHMIRGLWTDHDRLYRHLLTGFAPQEITLLDHQLCTSRPGGLAAAMLAHLGLPEAILPEPAEGEAAPELAGAPLAALAARRVADPHPVTRWMAEAAGGALAVQYGPDRPGTLWSRAQMASLRSYGDAAAARLATSRPGFALTPALPAPDTLYPEDLGSDFWRRCNRWLFAGTQGHGWSQNGS